MQTETGFHIYNNFLWVDLSFDRGEVGGRGEVCCAGFTPGSGFELRDPSGRLWGTIWGAIDETLLDHVQGPTHCPLYGSFPLFLCISRGI